MTRVVVAGASGLVGSALCARLERDGVRVDRLVRRSAGDGEIGWNPAAGTIDVARLRGADSFVHLGGVSIAARFTEAHKRAIRESRVRSTRLLAETIASLDPVPSVFVCASAVGYYGDRGDEILTEESPAGHGFLPDVCREWEAACEPARAAGIRVVHLRLGIVLSARGGALATMLSAFRWGLGGIVGDGRQYMSWIGLDDAVSAIRFALRTTTVVGPVNAVAPHPVTNREFTRTLGRVLGRPTILPAPAFAVRLALGEMGQALLLEGCRAIPARLQAAGFVFEHPTLEAALRHELRR